MFARDPRLSRRPSTTRGVALRACREGPVVQPGLHFAGVKRGESAESPHQKGRKRDAGQGAMGSPFCDGACGQNL
jgi:hypothetical protein